MRSACAVRPGGGQCAAGGRPACLGAACGATRLCSDGMDGAAVRARDPPPAGRVSPSSVVDADEPEALPGETESPVGDEFEIPSSSNATSDDRLEIGFTDVSPTRDSESALSPKDTSPRKSPHLIGIPSPKTWDEWIKRTSPTEETRTSPEELVTVVDDGGDREVLLGEEKWASPDTAPRSRAPPCKSASGECSLMKTIAEEPEDEAPVPPKSAIKKENSEPRVVIKNTRFQVIPAVDVWEPDPDRIGPKDEELLDDPRYETHLNQLTMVETQLKKLKKDVVIKKLDSSKAKEAEKKSGFIPGFLSIFKKKEKESSGKKRESRIS